MPLSTNLKDKKIVIIDDAPEWCKIMKITLEKEGCLVDTYTRHQEYIDKLTNEGVNACPDCLLIDFYLAGTEAPQVIREVKKVCETALILSVSCDFTDDENKLKTENMIEALNAGANRVIPKNIKEILDVMSSHLEVRKSLSYSLT